MAMLHACRHHPASFIVVAIDHGLRQEARTECAFVVGQAEKLGMNAFMLTPDMAIRANMNEARKTRLQLLLQAARSHHADEIWLAHQQDDQAETVAMRLKRQSHWRGLAGLMDASWLEEKLIKRPLLHASRAQLRQAAADIGFVDDPSNKDHRFERVRVRALLAKEPSLRDAMLLLARIAKHWRCQHAQYIEQSFNSGLIMVGPGHAFVANECWFCLGLEARSWLADLLRMYFRPGQWPRGGDKSRALASIKAGERLTLGFCIYEMKKNGLHVSRETGRVPPPATILPQPNDERNLLDLFQKGHSSPI